MLRFLSILLILITGFSCLKKKSIGPIPEIEFLDFKYVGPKGHDSADFKIGYIDSDGDLFGDRHNLFVRTLAYDAATGNYVSDTTFARIVRQPDNGYYEGKSIQGYIYLNEMEWRTPARPKVVRFEVFMKDQKDNKSNVVTSKTYTVNE
jgi:hypothetical protein